MAGELKYRLEKTHDKHTPEFQADIQNQCFLGRRDRRANHHEKHIRCNVEQKSAFGK